METQNERRDVLSHQAIVGRTFQILFSAAEALDDGDGAAALKLVERARSYLITLHRRALKASKAVASC